MDYYSLPLCFNAGGEIAVGLEVGLEDYSFYYFFVYYAYYSILSFFYANTLFRHSANYVSNLLQNILNEFVILILSKSAGNSINRYDYNKINEI
jgi:hypothetical protein